MHERAGLHRGALQDTTSHEVVELCLGMLRLLEQNKDNAPSPARSFADLLAHLETNMAGVEAGGHSDLHVSNPAVHAQADPTDFLPQ